MKKENKLWLSLLFIVVFLLCLGMVAIYSSSAIIAANKFGNNWYFLKKQLTGLAIGGTGLIVFGLLDYQYLKYLSKPLVGVSLTLLILVLLFGKEVNGAKRWLWGFQPAELVKVFLIIYLADFLSRNQYLVKRPDNNLLIPGSIVTIIILLILRQPSLGTASIIFLSAFFMLVVAGLKKRYLTIIATVSMAAVSICIYSSDYQKERVITWAKALFLGIIDDPLDKGYQINQSLIALGSGGPFGLGLGEGIQKLFFLPEPHNDFIFSIIGEEMGFLGSIIFVVLPFAVFVYLGLKIALRSNNLFGSLLAFGLTAQIGIQAILNLCVVTVLLPVTGVTLPFISFGSSSLVVSLFSVGIILNISKNKHKLSYKSLDKKRKAKIKNGKIPLLAPA